ncbi:MAG: type II toxin-antitoxin system prevent-host-death family antitoxin [Candidatus Wildermuthbacteria bacterium]|nr:type II toxin-antitoxin system prevent-host-death family antitoxin [Candidatus Wildermuthbacteria bacterium]
MDFNEIKNLIQQEGGKIIVVENGKPVMVVLSFEDFKARNAKKAQGQAPPEEPQGNGNNDEELTIDDLPL